MIYSMTGYGASSLGIGKDKINAEVEKAFDFAEKYTSIGDADTGVIAQDVDKLGLPGISTTRNDGVKVVRYERIVPVLIEAIKELKTEITSLKARVTTLEGS